MIEKQYPRVGMVKRAEFICVDESELRRLQEDGWEVETVDDVEIVASCEHCGLPILEVENYCHDDEGVYWHPACAD